MDQRELGVGEWLVDATRASEMSWSEEAARSSSAFRRGCRWSDQPRPVRGEVSARLGSPLCVEEGAGGSAMTMASWNCTGCADEGAGVGWVGAGFRTVAAAGRAAVRSS